jgi:hypothetical protein
MNNIPKVGDRHKFSKLTGYVLSQNRPSSCSSWRPSKLPENKGRYTSSCEGECGGNCNGVTTYYEGTVVERIFWADNSVDIWVVTDDGNRHRVEVVSPHGDVC